jgi:hypothetical protein
MRDLTREEHDASSCGNLVNRYFSMQQNLCNMAKLTEKLAKFTLAKYFAVFI